MTKPLSISVIVPAYNCATTIGATVAALLAQELSAREIIVVDDGSTDNTRAALEPFTQRITYLHRLNGGPAAARNTGIRAASGALVAFTDSDCLPRPDWLRRLSAGFTDERVAGVGGIVRSADHNTTSEYIDTIRLLDARADETNEIPYLITANACFRRDALLAAGLFDEAFAKPGGEEPDVCLRLRRLGYYFRAAEDAVVLHHHRQNLRSLLRTLANYGEGRYLLSRRWPEYSVQRPLPQLARHAIALRSLVTRAIAYSRSHGSRKGAYFSLLDYLRPMALLVGYLRGRSRAA